MSFRVLEIKEEPKVKLSGTARATKTTDAPKSFRVLNDIPEKSTLLQKAGKIVSESAKATARGFESTLGGIGALTKWYGEATGEIAERIPVSPKTKEMAKVVTNKIAKIGEDANIFWRTESQRGMEAPDPEIFKGKFTENPSWTRGVATVAGAIPSLATATAVTFATGNPLLGGASLGLLEGAEQYVESRDAGKSVPFSTFAVGVPSAVGNTLLESIPLTRFMRGGSGKLTKDILVGAVQEGGEEALQAVYSNSIAKLGYDKTRDLMEGVVEGVIAGAGSGGILGGFTSGRGLRTERLMEEAIEKGVTPQEVATIVDSLQKQVIDKAPEIEKILDNSGKKMSEMTKNIEKKKIPEPTALLKEPPLPRAKEKIKGIKSAIHEAVGLRKLTDTISLKETVLLKEQIKAESRGAKIGYQAGKKLIREQDRVKREVAGIVKSIQYAGKRNIPIEYKDLVDSQLESLGIETGKVRPLKARLKLSDFIEEQRTKGEIIPLSESEIALADYVDLGTATLDLLKRKKEIIDQIVHVGNNAGKLIAEKQAKDFEETEKKITESIYKSGRVIPKTLEVGYRPPSMRKKGVYRSTQGAISNMFAHLRKTEFIARDLDGRKDGPMQQEIIEKMQKAADKEMLDNERDLKKFRDRMNQFTSKEQNNLFSKPETIKGIPFKMTKAEMIGVYVNSLNRGNLRRITEMGFSENNIKEIVKQLPSKEKGLANLMLRIINNKWNETANTKLKLTGRRMGKVEGAYWPIVSDKDIDPRTKLRQGEKDLFQTVMNRTFVEKGFTKGRVGGIAPVDLNAFKVFLDHVTKVNHFNSHALAVRDVQKLIHSSPIRNAVTDAMGEEVYEQFAPWLREIANPTTYNTDATEKWVGRLRRNSTGAILGLKLSVSLVQAGSFSQTINELGFKDSMKGLADFYRHPIESMNFIYSKSPQMKFRENTFDREIKETLDSRSVKQLIKGDAKKAQVLYSLIKTIDKFTTLPTWLAAYNKKMKITNGDMDTSSTYADGVVRRTQPAGSVKDLAAVSRGSRWKKLFTMFYTHFSNYHNNMASEFHKLRKGNDPLAQRIGDATVAWWWLMVAPALFSKFVKSGGKEKRPEEYAKAVTGYAFSGLPGIRDIANAIINRRFTTLTSPAFAPFEQISKAGIEATKPLYGKEIKGRKLAEYSTKAIGYLTGLPTQQSWVTMDGIIDLMDGSTRDYRRLFLSRYQLGETNKKKGFMSTKGSTGASKFRALK